MANNEEIKPIKAKIEFVKPALYLILLINLYVIIMKNSKNVFIANFKRKESFVITNAPFAKSKILLTSNAK